MLEAYENPGFAAFANHLAFLATHRGTLRSGPDGYWLDGATSALSSWTPGPGVDRLPDARPTVRLAPWSGPDWPAMLEHAGYRGAEKLSYMELERLAPSPPGELDAEIEVARSEAALRDFAAVQAAGFATGDAAIDAWWAPFFAQVALANQFAPEQSFYLARVGGHATSTTLAVRAAGVTGIYAVATRPEHRCRGLARLLLERAATDSAGSHALERVILQAITGSYPETYYRKLGFRTAYELQVWRMSSA